MFLIGAQKNQYGANEMHRTDLVRGDCGGKDRPPQRFVPGAIKASGQYV